MEGGSFGWPPFVYLRYTRDVQMYLRPAPRRQLGRSVPLPGVIAPTPPPPGARVELINRRLTATGYVFGGLFSATSLLLFAMGRDRAGYMLGIASALWGATIGAIRVFAEE